MSINFLVRDLKYANGHRNAYTGEEHRQIKTPTYSKKEQENYKPSITNPSQDITSGRIIFCISQVR